MTSKIQRAIFFSRRLFDRAFFCKDLISLRYKVENKNLQYEIYIAYFYTCREKIMISLLNFADENP